MRNKSLNIVIKSDTDLSLLSSRRVTITKESEDTYKVTSTLKFYSCEKHSFVLRYIQRKKPGMLYFTGLCSTPTGYFWGKSTISEKSLATLRALTALNAMTTPINVVPYSPLNP